MAKSKGEKLPERGRYHRVAEKAERGEYDLIEPLDYLLLSELEPEGTSLAGLYPIGTTIKSLAKKERFKEVPSTLIAARIRSMHVQQLVKKVKMAGADKERKGATGSAWQVTESGQKLLQTWKGMNGNQN